MIQGNGNIDPNQNYTLINKFDLIRPYQLDQSSCDVFIIRDESHQQPNTVVDFSLIPYKSGGINFVRPTNDIYKTICEINGRKYEKIYSFNFNKGSYCNQRYELARKINLINRQRLQEQQRPFCPGVIMTHEGNAVTVVEGRRCLMALDLPLIEKEYSRIAGNKNSSLLPFMLIVLMVAGLITTLKS